MIPFMKIRSIFTGSRIVSLPFSDYCEPIIRNNESIINIINSVKKINNNKFTYLDLKGGESFLQNVKKYSTGYVHKLDLIKDENKIYQGMRSSNKRNIKKAEKEGIQIRFSKDYQSIVEFYKLNILTRQRHGIPPQPFKFFKNLYDILIKSGQCEIIEAVYENKVVASSVFFLFGKKVIYKFGASDYNYQNLRPNDLLFWQAIKHYKDKSYEELCFGRTITEHESLRQFKLGWGTQEFAAPYYRYDFKKDIFISNGNFNYSSPENLGMNQYIFQKIPKTLLKIIGTIAYKHIG